MWVVKLGGSLARSPRLPLWLATLAQHGQGRAIIVPGGGPFADLVRDEQARAGFGDSAAHRMAILAMEQFGFMLTGLQRDLCVAATEMELRSALEAGRVPVWLSYPMIIRDAALPEDWTITADSLSLWLAIHLKAEALLLVKSASCGDPAGIASLGERGALDRHFPKMIRDYAGDVLWMESGEYGLLGTGFTTGIPPGKPLWSGRQK